MCPVHPLQDCHGPTEWHLCFPRNTEFQGNVALSELPWLCHETEEETAERSHCAFTNNDSV